MGRLTAPFNGAYCASKWALEAMAESYRYELEPTGVEVSIVQPGVFKTGFVPSTLSGTDSERAPGYGLEDAYSKLQDLVRAMHDSPGASDPEEVARAVVALVEAPAGTRPLRVVVDPSGGGAGTEALNAAAAEVQRGLLTAMGMSQLLG
jgi:NAD(P)-dependent dehydrogenase (short-subunit alcohol dehydrogenase family)